MLQDLSRVAPTIQNIDETARLLGNLSLASIDEGQHLTVLAPIRSQVVKYQQLDQQSKRDLFFYHFELAKEGLRKIGDAGYVVGVKRLQKRQQNVEAILFSALEDGDVPAIEATLHYSSPRCTMRPRLDLVKKAVEAAKRNEFSVSQEQALRDGSVALTAQCIHRYGEINIEAGRFGQWFEEAIERFEKLGDQVSIAHCKILKAHGIWINDPKQGIKDLEQVRDTFAGLGNAAGEMKCQLKLADYYLADNRVEDARNTCDGLLSKSTDPYHTASCQQILARIYHRERRLEDARYLFVTSIEALKKYGDRFTSAECQVFLASVYYRLGRIDDAKASYRQAIMDYDLLGRNLKAAFARWNLGRIAETDEAIKVLEEAIPEFWKSEFTYAGAECRLDLGILCMRVGRLDDALLHLQIARPQLQANLTPEHAARCLSFIIVSHFLVGDKKTAALALEAGKYELHTYFQQEGLPGVPEPQNLTLQDVVNMFVLSTESMPPSIEQNLTDSEDSTSDDDD
jgi:tetratricopeptide (TPR) repeat protein